MALFNSLSDWATQVQQTNQKAALRGMNKALAKTNTQFKRIMSQQTGIKAGDLARRFRQKKASTSSFSCYVSFGTKIGIGLSEFKPKVKTVRVRPKNAKKRRAYQGVTVSIPAEGGRAVVPNAFLATVKSGKSLVLMRKGQSRLPTTALRYPLGPIAEQNKATLSEFFKNEFKNQYSAQIRSLTK